MLVVPEPMMSDQPPRLGELAPSGAIRLLEVDRADCIPDRGAVRE